MLANFPVWCAAEPPQAVTIDPAHDDLGSVTPEEAERRLFANVNRDRAAAGLPVLVWDDRDAGVAECTALLAQLEG